MATNNLITFPNSYFEFEGLVLNKDWDEDYRITQTTKKTSILTLKLSVDSGRKKPGEPFNERELFFITVFGHPKTESQSEGLAEKIVKQVKNKDKIRVCGVIHINSWLNAEGKKEYRTQFVLSEYRIIVKFGYHNKREERTEDETNKVVIESLEETETETETKNNDHEEPEEEINGITFDDIPF